MLRGWDAQVPGTMLHIHKPQLPHTGAWQGCSRAGSSTKAEPVHGAGSFGMLQEPSAAQEPLCTSLCHAQRVNAGSASRSMECAGSARTHQSRNRAGAGVPPPPPFYYYV